MTAAVIKLDSLPDAVWARPENHDLRTISRLVFVFFLVSRIEIRRVRFELGPARIDAFVDGNQAQLLAIGAYFIFAAPGQVSEPAIRKGSLLECTQQISRNRFERPAFDRFLDLHHLLELIEKPRIDARQAIDFVD